MLNKIFSSFTTLNRIMPLLSKELRTKSYIAFVVMFIQSLLELSFLLALTNMGRSLTDPTAIREMMPYSLVLDLLPSVDLWTQEGYNLLLFSGIMVVFVAFVKNLFAYFDGRLIAFLSNDISLYIGNEIMKRFLYKDYAWHLSNASQSMYQNMICRNLLANMLTHLLTLYSTVLTIVVLFLCLFGSEPVLTSLVVFLTSGVGIYLYYFMRKNVDVCGTQSAISASEETKALLCATKGIREVLIYGQQKSFLDAFINSVKTSRSARTFINIAPTMPTWILEVVGFAVVMLALAYLIYYEHADIARISAAMSLLLLTAWRVLPYCNRIVSLQIVVRSMQPQALPVLALLESLIADDKTNYTEATKDFQFKNSMKLKNVTFRYPDTEHDVLHDINLEIQQGETVGIIGASGGGKSTLVAILSGLLPATGGKFIVDGKEVSREDAAALAKHVGYVPQNPFLFAGTLAENIAFSEWGKEWDKERVLNACKLASIDFVESHPDELLRMIGDNGAGLSGGQAQRVSIARAMYPNPSIIIFDEATSALDQHNEKIIQETIDNLAHNVTCIIIAHRLTTVEKCDRLIWIEQGKVVMQGETDEILNAYKQTGRLN